MSKQSIESRLDDLEDGDSTAGMEINIRSYVVDENGELESLHSHTRVWEDSAGEWHSEKVNNDG